LQAKKAIKNGWRMAMAGCAVAVCAKTKLQNKDVDVKSKVSQWNVHVRAWAAP